MLAAGIVAYILVGLVAARAVAGHLAWEATNRSQHRKVPSIEDWVWSWIPGTVVGAMWPSWVALWLTGLALRTTARCFRAARRVVPIDMLLYIGAELKARQRFGESEGLLARLDKRGRIGSR